MDTSTIEHEAMAAREEAVKLAAPLQNIWKTAFLDLPLVVAAESMRFFGSRLQAHADHLANLNSCKSMPEVIETQSHFVRKTVDVYGHETNKIMEDVRGKMGEARVQMSKVQDHISRAA